MNGIKPLVPFEKEKEIQPVREPNDCHTWYCMGEVSMEGKRRLLFQCACGASIYKYLLKDNYSWTCTPALYVFPDGRQLRRPKMMPLCTAPPPPLQLTRAQTIVRAGTGDHIWKYGPWKRCEMYKQSRIAICACGLRKKERKKLGSATIEVTHLFRDGQWQVYSTGKKTVIGINEIPCIKKEQAPVIESSAP